MCCVVLTPLGSGLVSPESETTANNVVLVCHGVQAVMQRLDEMKISTSIHLVRVLLSNSLDGIYFL